MVRNSNNSINLFFSAIVSLLVVFWKEALVSNLIGRIHETSVTHSGHVSKLNKAGINKSDVHINLHAYLHN